VGEELDGGHVVAERSSVPPATAGSASRHASLDAVAIVRRMSGATAGEGRAVVQEIIQALGDEVAAESDTWWQHVFVVNELGHDCARQLVRDAHAVETAGGMTTLDGSRRRTPGGVFFVLAYQRLGPRRAKSVRWRAHRRVHQEALQRFHRLLALVLPASAEPPGVSTEAGTAKSTESATSMPRPSVPEPSPTASQPAATAPTASPALPRGPCSKPARRREPETVEVLVVRRRPVASPSTSKTEKAGPSTPGAGT